MSEQVKLAEQFESHRNHLQAVAYRMLGSLSEAEDAVQECWLRLSRSDTSGVENLGGWLNTVVSRVCLDMLRSRKSRREESMEDHLPETLASHEDRSDPEQEALMAESVGLALLVVLGNLNPAERVTFVLHDIFAMPFAVIAPIVEKSESAARQLASRARRRVHGTGSAPEADRGRQRELVDAFLAAAYAGDFNELVAALDPDVVLRDDRQPGASSVTRGARAIAKQVSGRAKAAQSALVNGTVGVIAAPRGRLLYVLLFTIKHGKIAEIDLISDPARIRRLDLAVFDD
ncbi:sigma-70 family RNA polymerase sigma factor [Paenibacillus mesophilus]|uniref:sigma-70 family RNA polymerase sigma factor n=1 Tax=Paenibacillus mesophilus TaxID=2582849 RepID=UPI00110DD113|nr:sigma-70 family RNA polymerase sigma factor [Paenibacillus mesophilus]TMV51268.1 sigma-70 family RNA polymerase sigma factor [Paenibacillus mesophilus]